MTQYHEATLISGRVALKSRVTLTTKTHGKITGDICEAQWEGKQHPRAVIKTRDALVCVQFANVAPGKTQKREVK